MQVKREQMNMADNTLSPWVPSVIAIADDHQFVCEFLSDLCQEKWPDATIYQVSDFAGMLELVQGVAIDLMVIDYLMPGGDGGEAISAVLGLRPKTKIIVFSGAISAAEVAHVLTAGIAAYVSKAAGAESLEKVIDLVVLGETHVPRSVVVEFLDGQPSLGLNAGEGAEIMRDLSAREQILLNELAKGLPNKVIAGKMRLSESTVKQAMRGLFRKLRVKNRTQAVVAALRLGIVAMEDGAHQQA